jgi:hypothetical protein
MITNFNAHQTNNKPFPATGEFQNFHSSLENLTVLDYEKWCAGKYTEEEIFVMDIAWANMFQPATFTLPKQSGHLFLLAYFNNGSTYELKLPIPLIIKNLKVSLVSDNGHPAWDHNWHTEDLIP